MDDQSYDRDEYETDTDASESGSDYGSSNDGGSSDDSNDDEGELEQYSLRVRLLSAVDLPPSLSPSVPLCPWFRFGLVEDLDAALDGISEERRRARAREEADRAGRGSRTLRPMSQGDDEEEDDDDETDANIPARQQSASAAAAGLNTTAQLLASLPPSSTRTSTHKIMSRNANGGGGNGADWNEEYRWDSLSSPMESCLAVQLVTRLAPESRFDAGQVQGNQGMGSSSFGSSLNLSGLDHSEGDESAALAGIRGLWRKGREQLEQRRMSMAAHEAAHGAGGYAGLAGGQTQRGTGAGVTAGPREEAAAAAAQVLMRGGDDQSTVSNLTMGSGLNQGDLVEYQARWNEHSASSGGDADGSARSGAHRDYVEGAVRTTRSEDERDAHGPSSEGLCLGTLSIPIHHLELNEAVFEGRKAAVLEKWYQLDDPNVKRKAEVSVCVSFCLLVEIRS